MMLSIRSSRFTLMCADTHILPEASLGLRVLSLPACVWFVFLCVCVCSYANPGLSAR